MNLKEHIIEINDEKLDDWNLLNWDNPNPYDYRYYKMLGLALFERVFGQNAFPLDKINTMYDTGYNTSNRFLTLNAYLVYSLHRNSILDFKLLLSLYNAYLYYFLFFINKDNINSKFCKEIEINSANDSSVKVSYLHKCYFYTMDDLPIILKNKYLDYGTSLETYKDFLVGMYQMACMMRWRCTTKLASEASFSHGEAYGDTYNEAFSKAFNKALSDINSPNVSSSLSLGSSSVTKYSENFRADVSMVRNTSIKCYQKLPYDSTVELYIGRHKLLTGQVYEIPASASFDETEPSYLTDSIMLYDRKNVNKNEIITFKLEDLKEKDYIIKLPSYDEDDTFHISKYKNISYLLIYDCNNSYKLKAN